MSNPILKIHSAAEAEIAEARDWYAARSQDAAKQFLLELDRALEHVSADPQLAPKYLHGTRGYLLRNYRYVLVYEVIDSTIRILALAHASRRPGYWRHRLRQTEDY